MRTRVDSGLDSQTFDIGFVGPFVSPFPRPSNSKNGPTSMLQMREKPPPIKEMTSPISLLKVREFVKYSYSSATLGTGGDRERNSLLGILFRRRFLLLYDLRKSNDFIVMARGSRRKNVSSASQRSQHSI
jgi:hypothetical protein